MALSASDIQTWSHPGTKDAMAATYATVKKTLESSPVLAVHDIEIFLQGSYANATNIRGDSDVDIVVMLRSSFAADTSRLSLLEKITYDRDHFDAMYGVEELRRDVTSVLTDKFGIDRVEPRKKSIRLHKVDGYVDADIVPAIQYRKYTKYVSKLDQGYIEGVKIKPLMGNDIINFPKQHIINGHSKNLSTDNNFKPAVRQMKQLKRRLVNQSKLDPKNSPGYLIECITYNVPANNFVDDHHTRLLNVLLSLYKADFSNFYSVDGIHTLFGTDPGNFRILDAKQIVRRMLEEMIQV